MSKLFLLSFEAIYFYAIDYKQVSKYDGFNWIEILNDNEYTYFADLILHDYERNS